MYFAPPPNFESHLRVVFTECFVHVQAAIVVDHPRNVFCCCQVHRVQKIKAFMFLLCPQFFFQFLMAKK